MNSDELRGNKSFSHGMEPRMLSPARFYGRFAFAVPELALAVRRIASMLHAQGMSFHEVGEEGISARHMRFIAYFNIFNLFQSISH